MAIALLRTPVNPFDLKTLLLAKHAQHVVLIHFPIALFIAAVAFDLIAHWTKRRGLTDAAYYNLLVAAISTVLVTGILAWQYQLDGQKLKGIVSSFCNTISFIRVLLLRPPRSLLVLFLV